MLNDSRPLVSICIPTFNRADYLVNSLNSIIKQKEFLNKEVEVIISDNASADNTKKIGIAYEKTYSNIHYYCNEKNIKDQNFPLSLSRGTGILRKLCNDTMMYLDGSLKCFCNMAEKYEESRPLLFFSNASCSDEKMYDIDFLTFLRRISFNITWIGGFSIWGSECDNIEHDIKGCDLRLWQVEKLCSLMNKKNKAIILDKHFCDMQTVAKKDISYGLYKVFYQNYFAILDPYLIQNHFSSGLKEWLEKDLLYRFFTGWILQWEHDNPYQFSKEENLKNLVFTQYQDKPYFEEYKRYYQKSKLKGKIKRILNEVLGAQRCHKLKILLRHH